MNFTQQLEYLKQEETRATKRLEKIYEVYSNEEWELLGYLHYENPTGCDYPKCSRGNPSNGIKHVYRVQSKKTGEQLNLGSTCYLKLFFGKDAISKAEKRGFEKEVRNIGVNKTLLEQDLAKNQATYLETIRQIQSAFDLIKVELQRYGVPFEVERFENLQTNTYEENVTLAGILEKYKIELQRLKALEGIEQEKQQQREQKVQAEQAEKSKAQTITNRKNELRQEHPTTPEEVLEKFLALKEHLVDPKIDLNQVEYYECETQYFADLMDKTLLEVIKELKQMEKYKLLFVDKLRIYLL